MKKYLIILLSFCIYCLSISANKVGVYCFFADNGSHLYEDKNVKLGVAMTDIGVLSVVIVNKTNNVLYIDKANSFIYTNSNIESLFVNAVYSVGGSSGNSASLNLGGAAKALGIGGLAGGILSGTTVGGGSSTTNTTTIIEERVIRVAPQSSQKLQDIFIYSSLSSDYITTGAFGWSKGRFIDSPYTKGKKFKKGNVRNYSENASPLSVKASIKYSTKETFTEENSYQITSSNYIEHVVIDNYKGVTKKGKKLPYCTPYLEKSCFAFRCGGMDAKYAIPLSITYIGFFVWLFGTLGEAY